MGVRHIARTQQYLSREQDVAVTVMTLTMESIERDRGCQSGHQPDIVAPQKHARPTGAAVIG
ncbi:hypothetical protein EMIT0347P_10359 [Pseudomonas sp. IT-347P]